jgi:hypothetical protein
MNNHIEQQCKKEKKELLSYINNNCLKQNGTISPLFLKQLENNIQFKEQFYILTKFLELNNNDKYITHHERYYCLINNIQEIKKCPICKENELKFISFPLGYNKTCSKKCKYILSIQSIEKTNIERYGTKSTLQVKEVQNKIEQTNLELYGSKTYMGTKNFLEKTKEYNVNKHGVEHFSKTEEYKKNFKQTNLELYGYEHAMKNKEIQQKQENTVLEKYNTNNIATLKTTKEKKENTNLQRYGKNHVFQVKEVQNKIEQTNIERYGHEHATQNKDIKLKIDLANRKTCLKKYGVEFYTQKHINNLKEFSIDFIKENFVFNKNKLNKNQIEKHFNIKRTKINRLIQNNQEEFIGIKTKIYITEIEIKEYVHKILTSYIEELNLNNTNIFYNFLLLSNNRKILKNNKELDIYFEINSFDKANDTLFNSHKIAIEYNGFMFHSFGINKNTIFNNYEKESIQKNKHLQKTIECEQKGIQLFHINEEEWLNPIKQNIWKNIISNKINTILKIKHNQILFNQCYIKKIELTNENKKIINSHLTYNCLENNFLKIEELTYIGIFHKETKKTYFFINFL